MVKIDTFVIKLKFKSNKLNILYIIKTDYQIDNI